MHHFFLEILDHTSELRAVSGISFQSIKLVITLLVHQLSSVISLIRARWMAILLSIKLLTVSLTRAHSRAIVLWPSTGKGAAFYV